MEADVDVVVTAGFVHQLQNRMGDASAPVARGRSEHPLAVLDPDRGGREGGNDDGGRTQRATGAHGLFPRFDAERNDARTGGEEMERDGLARPQAERIGAGLAERQGEGAKRERGGFAGRDVGNEGDDEVRLPGGFTPQRIGGPICGRNAIWHTVIVLVSVERIRAGEDFRGVGEPIAVGVGLVRVGTVEEDLVPVGEPVIVRVCVRVDPGRVLPFDGEARRRAEDAVRAEQVRDGNAIRDARAVHAPDGGGERVRSEDGERVHAVRSDLPADDEVRRGRVERVREVVAAGEVAGGQQFGLDGHAAAWLSVEQGFLPGENPTAAGRGVVPEARSRAGAGPVRLGNHAEGREERSERGKSGAVGQRSADGRAAHRVEGDGAVRGDVGA